MSNIYTGITGESTACSYLEKVGLSIVCRNFRCKSGEIDIIALDGDRNVFVEVKSRKLGKYGELDKYGRASNAVDKRKRACFIKAAEEYIRQNPNAAKCRIDVIEVYFNGTASETNAQIKHIKSAFGRS